MRMTLNAVCLHCSNTLNRQQCGKTFLSQNLRVDKEAQAGTAETIRPNFRLVASFGRFNSKNNLMRGIMSLFCENMICTIIAVRLFLLETKGFAKNPRQFCFYSSYKLSQTCKSVDARKRKLKRPADAATPCKKTPKADKEKNPAATRVCRCFANWF